MPTKRQAPLAKPKQPTAQAIATTVQFTYEVTIGSSFGCAEPQLRVTSLAPAEGQYFRLVRAELFRLANMVELGSIAGSETWVVGTKVGSDRAGCVYLELAHSGSKGREEQDRGYALLRAIVVKAGEAR